MSSPDLHIQAEDLLRAQLAEWPMAGSNYAALEGVRVREIDIDGITMKVQFNPARIVSSGAKVPVFCADPTGLLCSAVCHGAIIQY